jgi:hypothetical protein
MARYGRFIQLTNTSTPEQHAAFLNGVGKFHKQVVAALAQKIEALQALVSKYDPVEIMHMAAYMLLQLFMKHQSEYEYTHEESRFLPTAEYLQYLISRTPPDAGARKFDEAEWQELWGVAIEVLDLTYQYLFTRKTESTPPSEIDELRFMLDGRRLMVRVRRYSAYFSDHLKNSLLPYGAAIKEAYGIDINMLIDGLEQVNAYQKEGVIDRYIALMEANQTMMQMLRNRGFSVTRETMEAEEERLREVLQTPEFEVLNRELAEKARLTLTPAIFDVTEVTSLPRAVLSILSVRPGESPALPQSL